MRKQESSKVQMLSKMVVTNEIFTRYPLKPQIYTEYPTNVLPEKREKAEDNLHGGENRSEGNRSR